MATTQPAGSCTHHSMNLSRANARLGARGPLIDCVHLDHALGQIHPYRATAPSRITLSTDFPFHWLQIDDFEHHQSWRLDAVARRWEVPSHSHRADSPQARFTPLRLPLMSNVTDRPLSGAATASQRTAA